MASTFNSFTSETKEECRRLIVDGESAFDMLIENRYNEETKYSAADIATRLQIQYFLQSLNKESLRSDGMDGWWQNEAYEPNEVFDGVKPIMVSKKNRLFSSFALKEVDGKNHLNYPLDDDFVDPTFPFSNKSMDETAFTSVVDRIKNTLNINIVDGYEDGKNKYKRSIINFAITKIKNFGLKLIRKSELAKLPFKGKMRLATATPSNYKYSNIEKITKIYDLILDKVMSHCVKTVKKNSSVKVSDDVRFAGKLFANVLMTRATNFGDNEINKTVEKCLFLQFSNVINRAGFSAKEMSVVTELGLNLASLTCSKMGMTTAEVISRMNELGYTYDSSNPKTIKDAFALAREMDYSHYATAIVNEERESQKKAQARKQKAEEQKSEEKNDFIVDKPEDVEKLATPEEETVYYIAPNGTVYEGSLPDEAEVAKQANENREQEQAVATEQKTEIIIQNNGIEFSKTKVKENSVAKVVNEEIIKMFTDKAASIGNNLKAHRYSLVGGKEYGEKCERLIYETIVNYQRLVNSDAKVDEYINPYRCNGDASRIAKFYISLKDRIAEDILQTSKYFGKSEDEKIRTYINRAIKEEFDDSDMTLKKLVGRNLDEILKQNLKDTEITAKV